MLRTNLSTRPFYNERAAHVADRARGGRRARDHRPQVVRIVSLSRHNTELSSRIGADARRSRAADGGGRRGSGGRSTRTSSTLVVGAAEEANALIDQRTFSWTAVLQPDRIDAAPRRDADVGAAGREGRRDPRDHGRPGRRRRGRRRVHGEARGDGRVRRRHPGRGGSHRGRAAPRRAREHLHRRSTDEAPAEAAPDAGAGPEAAGWRGRQ